MYKDTVTVFNRYVDSFGDTIWYPHVISNVNLIVDKAVIASKYGEVSKDNDEEDYIITDGEIPIGWLGINSLESADKVAYLKLAAILPEYHNKGIGRYAINQVMEMLRQRKYLKVALYTDQENYKARACYSKCGFEVTETFMEEMANGKTVARCKMELDLT